MASYRVWGDRIYRIIVLDTNALLMIFEYSIDLVDELTRLVGKTKIVIPQAVIEELYHIIKKSNGSKKQKAQAALKFIEQFPVISHDADINGDDAVLQVAQEHHGIVVTNDQELRKRLKRSGITAIFLRGKQRLSID